MINPLRWISERFAAPQRGTFGSVLQFLMGAAEMPGITDYSSFAEAGYRSNSIVYACINAIARSVADPALRALTLLPGGTVQTDDFQTDPLARLVLYPNEDDTQYEFYKRLMTHLYISGNAFIFKRRALGSGVPVALDLIPPQVVGVLEAPGGGVEAYTVEVGGQTIRLARRDVVHFSLTDALDGFFGLSPLYVIRRYLDIDLQAGDLLRTFFRNRGIPSGLLSIDGRVQDTERDRVRKLWNDQFGNDPSTWFNIAVLDSRVTYTPLNAGIGQMDLSAVTGQTETRICMAFGVPPSYISTQVGLARATHSVFGQARAVFWSDTLRPLFTQLSARLTKDLAVSEFGPNRQIVFDLSTVDALQGNRSEIRKIALQGWSQGLLQRNSALQLLGLPPVSEGGEDVKVQSGTVFQPAGQDPVDDKESEIVPTTVQRLPAKREALAATREEQWQVVHRHADGFAMVLSGLLDDLFSETRGSFSVDTLQALLGNSNTIEAASTIVLPDLEVVRERFLAALENLFVTLSPEVIEFLDLVDLSEVSADSPAVRSALLSYVDQVVESLYAEQRRAINRAIEVALSGVVADSDRAAFVAAAIGLTAAQVDRLAKSYDRAAEGGDDVARVLREASGALAFRRKDTFTRTASIDAASLVQESVWKELLRNGDVADGDLAKFWVVTPDDRLDSLICAPIPGMNPNGVPLDGVFSTPVGDVERPTVHNHCRCSMVVGRRARG